MKNILSYNDFLKEDAGDGGGCAMATNSSSGGMGAITSASPSAIPGSVWATDATKGSGDVGQSIAGTYFKPTIQRKRKKRRKV